MNWVKLSALAKGLSYADVTRATGDALKHALIEGRALTHADLHSSIAERGGKICRG